MQASEVTLLRLHTKTSRGTATGEEQVELYNDEWFKQVREQHGIATQLLVGFDFEKGLQAGGGKGGDLMGFTECGRFLIKEVKPSDQESLLKYAQQYVEHVVNSDPNKASLLPLFYLHFKRTKTGDDFVVMNNFLPNPNNCPARDISGAEGVDWYDTLGIPLADEVKDPTKVKGWDLKYDLKGCMDDKTQARAGVKIEEVHKRFFKFWMFCGCGISKDRELYAEGKRRAYGSCFKVTSQQSQQIRRMIENDAHFCAKNNLMDHSLIIGQLSYPIEVVQAWDGDRIIGADKPGEITEGKFLFPKSAIRGQPYLSEYKGRVYALYIGVIDFLQEWNGVKKVAHCIKACCAPKPMSTVDPNEYAVQFKTLMDRFDGCAKEFVRSAEQDEAFTANDGDDLTDTMWFRGDWEEHEMDDVDAFVDQEYESQLQRSTSVYANKTQTL